MTPPSRVGQVFMGATWCAVVTEGPKPPRREGSSTPSWSKRADDLPVYTLCLWGDSGVHWPVERLEDCLRGWEAAGRLFPS